MYINRVNSFNVNAPIARNNGEKAVSSPQNINFVGRVNVHELVVPEFKNPSSTKIFEKIQTYLKIIPQNSKIVKPIKVAISDGKDVAFTIDKQASNLTKIVIRDKIEKLENWETPVAGQNVIHMFLDNKGQMINGEFVENSYNDFGFRLEFERLPKNYRVMVRNDVDYRPSGKDQNLWSAVDRYQERKTGYSTVGPRAYKENYLDEIFFEMAKLYTTFIK